MYYLQGTAARYVWGTWALEEHLIMVAHVLIPVRALSMTSEGSEQTALAM
jgi:hypothetical protein